MAPGIGDAAAKKTRDISAPRSTESCMFEDESCTQLRGLFIHRSLKFEGGAMPNMGPRQTETQRPMKKLEKRAVMNRVAIAQ